MQRQYFASQRCPRHCSDSLRHCSHSTCQHAGAREMAVTLLLSPQVFTPLQQRPATPQRQHFSTRKRSRHCSGSTSQPACVRATAAIVRDTAATVLLNPHVFTTLPRQYFSTRRCSPTAATVHDTAATVLFNAQVLAKLLREYCSTRRCSRRCSGSPRHRNDNALICEGVREIAATVLLNPHVFMPLQR